MAVTTLLEIAKANGSDAAVGLIEESGERPDPALDDERRRYYRMTDFGLRVTRAESQRLESCPRHFCRTDTRSRP